MLRLYHIKSDIISCTIYQSVAIYCVSEEKICIDMEINKSIFIDHRIFVIKEKTIQNSWFCLTKFDSRFEDLKEYHLYE